jgi:hypothetical protein
LLPYKNTKLRRRRRRRLSETDEIQGVAKALVASEPMVGELTVRNSKRQYETVCYNMRQYDRWQNMAELGR